MKVRCNDCWWHGDESELERDAEGYAETLCPQCGREDYLMDLENEEE